MGSKIRCLKCGDIIESKHVHDFKFCSCGNIFIDGGDEYTRYGGKALDDGSAEFILDDGKTVNVFGSISKPFNGIYGYTKIGLFRNELDDPMYLNIEDMNPAERYVVLTSGNIYGVSRSIKKSEEKLQTYKYIFNNDCSIGKQSFGTEEEIVATPDTKILKKDGSIVFMGDLKDGDEVLSIKRTIYSKETGFCTSKLFHSFKFYEEFVYNIEFKNIIKLKEGSCLFCANGFFIGGIDG